MPIESRWKRFQTLEFAGFLTQVAVREHSVRKRDFAETG